MFCLTIRNIQSQIRTSQYILVLYTRCSFNGTVKYYNLVYYVGQINTID